MSGSAYTQCEQFSAMTDGRGTLDPIPALISGTACVESVMVARTRLAVNANNAGFTAEFGDRPGRGGRHHWITNFGGHVADWRVSCELGDFAQI